MGPLGEIRRDGDTLAVRFEREYPGDADTVWAALTTPDRLARWLGRPVGRLAEGEVVDLLLGESDDEKAALRIDVCERPSRIEGMWQFPGEVETTLRVTLAAAGPGGTLVTLDHTGWRPERTAGYGAGWHHYVDCLDAHLRDEPLPSFDDYYPATLDVWRSMVAAAL